MSSKKKNLQTAATTSHAPLIPPADLWERMEKALAELKAAEPPRPPGGFTRKEFEQRFGVTACIANRRLQQLQQTGKVKRTGSTGRNVFYVMV